jgi:hypothetical protein
VRALVWLVLQLPPVEELVEGLVVVVAREEVVAAHLEVPQGVHRVVPDSGVPLRPEADLEVLPEILASLVAVTDLLEQMDYLLSPMVPVQVLVPAFRGVLAWVGSLDLSPVGIGAEGGVATVHPPVETVPLTRWFPPW